VEWREGRKATFLQTKDTREKAVIARVLQTSKKERRKEKRKKYRVINLESKRE
jgi:hypothetical protein